MRKIIITLIVFASFLLIIFFWGELDELSLEQKINDNKVANFFTSFGGIIVSISLYFLYKQLREMKSGYLPDLYLSYTEFRVKILPGRDYLNDKSAVKVFNIEDGKDTDINGYFRLHNIGLGSSKNISIKWNYDLKSVKEVFNDKYQYWPILSTENQHIDFLDAKNNTQIDIPEFYFNCCAPEYNFNINNHREVSEKMLKGISLKPKIEVMIKYQDIQNEIYTKKFEVEIIPIEDKLRIKFKVI